MSNWYSLNLGDPMLADERLDAIEREFRSTRERAGPPRRMAAFVRHESEGRLHCEVVVYFSPEAEAVARRLGAAPGAAPSPYGLSPLGGEHQGRN